MDVAAIDNVMTFFTLADVLWCYAMLIWPINFDSNDLILIHKRLDGQG